MARTANQSEPEKGKNSFINFRRDLHPGLRDDYFLANPPFNMSDWGGENLRQDVRNFSLSASIGERAGVRCRILFPPVNNAWVQHFLHHLSPVGVAGFVMAKITRSAHSCFVKITEDVRKYAAEEVLTQGMKAKSEEFVEKGA